MEKYRHLIYQDGKVVRENLEGQVNCAEVHRHVARVGTLVNDEQGPDDPQPIHETASNN
jgi:hypothetical protein